VGLEQASGLSDAGDADIGLQKSDGNPSFFIGAAFEAIFRADCP
jgi:hypothetical protein